MSFRRILFKNREFIRLFFYFIIVVIFTYPLLDLFIRSWELEYGLMQPIADIIRYFDPSGVTILITFFAGLYFGFLFLMFLDYRKRVQAILLLISIIIIISYINVGFIFPNVDWSNNSYLIGLGMIVGIIMGGGSNILKDKNEFQKSAKYLSKFSILFILFVFINYNFQSFIDFVKGITPHINENFLNDLIVVFIFIYFFRAFVTYEVKGPKFFVLGSARAGKSLFLCGCYLKAFEIMDSPLKPSDDLMNFCDELIDTNKNWPAFTSTIREYEFTYVIGRLFPKYTSFKTIDYPGGYLEIGKISEFLNKINKNLPSINREKKNGYDKDDQKYIKIAQEINRSDKLIFIIDGEKYEDFINMGINEYIKILRQMYNKGKIVDAYIVVTKCDIFLDEYKESPDFNNVDLNTDNGYDNFRKFIENKFSKSLKLKQLIHESSFSSFYPVFYHTQMQEDQTLLLKDDVGNVFTFGFDRIINDLTK